MNIILNSSYDLNNNDLNQYLSSITKFIDDKQLCDSNIIFNLRLWAYNLNDEHTKYIIEYLESYYNIKIENKNNKRLKPKVILTFEDSFEWPNLNNPYNTDKGTCLGLKTHVSILSNGDVGVCCLDTLCDSKLGNILDSSFEEIINSSKAKEVLKVFNDNKLVLDICKHCTYHNRKK
jgi:radical SAM protein with 4Fe4S-binding SPASM domain